MNEGERLRDEGINLVLENSAEEWRDGAYAFIRNLPTGWTGTGEDIRIAFGQPSHAPQAWGAVINTAVRRNWLEPTGKYRKMRQRSSHARETRVYVRTAEQSQ